MNQQILLRFERHSDNGYYLALLYRDLLGDLILTKVWGAAGKSAGRQLNILLTSKAEGLALIDKVIKQCRKRGYELVHGLADIQLFANAV